MLFYPFEFLAHHLFRYPKIEVLQIFFKNIRGIYYLVFRSKRIESSLNNFEFKGYSQNGEDGIILEIFNLIGTTNNYFLEIGVQDGSERNTRLLEEKFNWRGLLLDSDPKGNKKVKKEFLTKENIERVLNKYKVPKDFDLMSVDIDGNDYWIWDAIKQYKPRVVVIEYNSSLGPHVKKVIKYDPNFRKTDTNYYGASLRALTDLAEKKGYNLVACDSKGINSFFVLKSFKMFKNYKISDLYRPPKFGEKMNNNFVGYKKDKRKMINV